MKKGPDGEIFESIECLFPSSSGPGHIGPTGVSNYFCPVISLASDELLEVIISLHSVL